MRALRRMVFLLLLTAAAVARPVVIHAQADPAAGVRAAGMAGAFTAATDDASAVVWNPAGLASGSYFSALADVNVLHTIAGSPAPSATLVAIGTPPLGLSFRRAVTVRFTGTSPTGAASTDRNTAGEVHPRTLVTQQAGVTLVHSLADGLAVGATLKVVHGVISGAGSTTADADIGVMKVGDIGRLGLTVSNLRQPAFSGGADGPPIRLDRKVRIGVALNVARATLVAADVDLNKTAAAHGTWRDAAIGVEHQPLARAWIRGGVRWNTAGGAAASAEQASGAAPVASFGASYAVYGRTNVDAQVTVGSRQGDRGWGVGLRFVY